MSRLIPHLPNCESPDSDYPNGRIKDNTGGGNGTPVNEYTNGDFHQFFAKLMDLAGITQNQLPDNEYNGYQLMQALGLLAFYKHTSVSSLSIATGSKTFTLESETHAFEVGMYVQAYDQANSANYMKGHVTGTTDTTVTVLVNTTGGSGTISAWNINLGAIEDSGWVTMTAENNWENELSRCAYRKVGNVVYLRGRMVANGDESSATCFTLPTGFRPSIGSQTFPAIVTSQTSPTFDGCGAVVISSTGTIGISGTGSGFVAGSSSGNYNLDGICFPTS